MLQPCNNHEVEQDALSLKSDSILSTSRSSPGASEVGC